jgi:hypothetical protein
MPAPMSFMDLTGAKIVFSGFGPAGFGIHILTDHDQLLGRSMSVAIICCGKTGFRMKPGANEERYLMVRSALESGVQSPRSRQEVKEKPHSKDVWIRISDIAFIEGDQCIEFTLDDVTEVRFFPTDPLGEDKKGHVILYDYRSDELYLTHIIGTNETDSKSKDWESVAAECGMGLADKKFLKLIGRI